MFLCEHHTVVISCCSASSCNAEQCCDFTVVKYTQTLASTAEIKFSKKL